MGILEAVSAIEDAGVWSELRGLECFCMTFYAAVSHLFLF